jgi:hypothetical protein
MTYYVRSDWGRCGNTLFYAKLRHHEEVGGLYIDPADLVEVRWTETPEGFLLRRREVPETDWAGAELVRFNVSQLPNELQRRFWTWLNFMDVLKSRGSSPSEVVSAFSQGFAPLVRNETLDAIELGVFGSALNWVEKTGLVLSREELDEALANLGVMECPM